MLLRPGDLDIALDPADLFGRRAPLFLEIGFGGGEFLDYLAEAHPEANVLGAELSSSSTEKSLRRMRRNGRDNVRLALVSGEFAVRELLAPGALDRVYVNFPDPWPKQKHRDRRLLQPWFFEVLSTRLRNRKPGLEPDDAGGTIYLTTDHAEYFEWAVRMGRRTGLFAIETGPPPEPTLKTKYAHRWQDQHKTIHHAVFRKTGQADGDAPHLQPQIQTSDQMQHAILEGRLPQPSDFQKTRHAFSQDSDAPPRQAILLDVWADTDRRRLVWTVRTEEPDLVQEILIEAYVSESEPETDRPERIVVQVKPFGKPLQTAVTGRAVELVAEWLEAAEEENKVMAIKC